MSNLPLVLNLEQSRSLEAVLGNLEAILLGYDEVVKLVDASHMRRGEVGRRPQGDLDKENTSSSCSHGVSFAVNWPRYMNGRRRHGAVTLVRTELRCWSETGSLHVELEGDQG